MKPRICADTVRSFAETHGVTVRSAQRHKKAATEQWLRHVGVMPVAPEIGEDSLPVESRSASLIDDQSSPDAIERAHLAMWRETVATWERMGSTSDPVARASVALAAGRLRADFERAARAREMWEIGNRRLVPIADFQALMPLLSSVFNLVRGFPAEIAMAANPASPATARQAGEEWLRGRFQPQAKALLDKLELAAA